MKKILLIAGIVLLLIVAFVIIKVQPVLSLDMNNLPKFVIKDALDLSKFSAISKFRSGAGHSYAVGGESCRSMKHYFMPKEKQVEMQNPPTEIDPEKNIPVYSPVNGTIKAIVSEHYPLGKQWAITPDGYPAYSVKLFHVYPLSTMKVGVKVKAGDRIGIILPTQQTDIAVNVMTLKGEILLSYFDVMSDEVFKTYKDRGITKENIIITKVQRDANPLECKGKEEFTTQSDMATDWVTLK